MTEEVAEELFRQVAAFASFGFAKSHAAAFARTAYESSFLKLFYPAQFLVGLINAQPMGFYPVEVLVNDAKRHGVAVLPVDINRIALQDDDRVGRAAGLGDGADGADEPLPDDAGIERRPDPGPVERLRDAVGRGPRAVGGRERRRLGRPARAAGSSRGSARSTRRCSTRSWRAARTARWRTSSSGRACRRRRSSG